MKQDYAPAERFEALAYFFGWQGGSCHQLDEATGCRDVTSRALERDRGLTGSTGGGFSSVRTCDRDWRRDRLAPQERGNWPYWVGVIDGYFATGALGGAEFSARFREA
jgi:hypothetical protein